MDNATTIRQSTITQQVYENVRERIINHSIKPGSRLIVSKIASELGVSASPVRETLRLLQEEGLADMAPHRGAVSVTPTKKGFEDLFKVRRELEAMAVRETAKSITPKLIKELDSILERAEKAIDKNDLDEWGETDDSFHLFFRKNCGNDVLKQMLSKMMVWVVFYRQLVSGSPSGTESLAEHKKVIDKIREGDSDGAAKAMLEHIDRALQEGVKRI